MPGIICSRRLIQASKIKLQLKMSFTANNNLFKQLRHENVIKITRNPNQALSELPIYPIKSKTGFQNPKI
jgi:hypothetical protein